MRGGDFVYVTLDDGRWGGGGGGGALFCMASSIDAFSENQ